MKKGLLMALIILSAGCYSELHSSDKMSKSQKIKKHLAGGYFEFLLNERSIPGISTLELKEDSFVFTDGGPFVSFGNWTVSSNGKYLILDGKSREKVKFLDCYNYSDVKYEFKIKNPNTLIWIKNKWHYKRVKKSID